MPPRTVRAEAQSQGLILHIARSCLPYHIQQAWNSGLIAAQVLCPFFFAHEETDTQNLNDWLKVKEVVSIVSMGQLSRKL